MGDVSNKASPLPLVLPAKDLGASARTKATTLALQQKYARIHKGQIHENRSTPENRRSQQVGQAGRATEARLADDTTAAQETFGDESSGTARQSAQPAVLQDGSSFGSSTLPSSVLITPQALAQNPALPARTGSSPRPGGATPGKPTLANTGSRFEGARSTGPSLNGGGPTRNAFLELVNAARPGTTSPAPTPHGAQANAQEAHTATREERAAAQVKHGLLTAATAARLASAGFSPMAAIRAATQAAQLGQGPVLEKDRIKGKDQHFGDTEAADGESAMGGPVALVKEFATGHVVYDASEGGQNSVGY